MVTKGAIGSDPEVEENPLFVSPLMHANSLLSALSPTNSCQAFIMRNPFLDAHCLVGGRCHPVRHTQPAALPTHLPTAEKSDEDESGEEEAMLKGMSWSLMTQR